MNQNYEQNMYQMCMKMCMKCVTCIKICKSNFNKWKCKSNQNWNNDKLRWECKNPKRHHAQKKDYNWNSVTCSFESGNYLASIIDDSVLTCDKIVKETITVPTNCNKKR